MISYRLEEYKIVYPKNDQITWESHCGFAESRTGRGFVRGAILLLGQADSHEIGFLKGEFLDSLKGLPEWNLTKYYCTSVVLRNCSTMRKAKTSDMVLWAMNKGKNLSDPSSRVVSETDLSPECRIDFAPGLYSLGKYEVRVESGAIITWKAYTGKTTFSIGECMAIEEVLFLKPFFRSETDATKRTHFLSNLSRLPKWSGTQYFCEKSIVRCCLAPNVSQVYTARTLSTGKEDSNNATCETGLGRKRPQPPSEYPYRKSLSYKSRLPANFGFFFGLGFEKKIGLIFQKGQWKIPGRLRDVGNKKIKAVRQSFLPKLAFYVIAMALVLASCGLAIWLYHNQIENIHMHHHFKGRHH